jgi:hypothetical protein
MLSNSFKAISTTLTLTALLTACGGGDGGGAPPPPPTAVGATCASGGVAAVNADTTASVGRAAGATLIGCKGALTDVKWTQTAGTPVNILSDRMQAISFDPPAAGTYSFSVTFKDSTGTTQTGSASITAAAAPATSTVNARLDQAVRGGSDVSMRAWPQLVAGDTPTAANWTQIEGPEVTLNVNTSDPVLAQFVAPTVTTDTLYKFRVNLQTANGTTATDDVSVVVQALGQAPVSTEQKFYFFDGVKVSLVHPYKPTSKYASKLVDCVYNPQLYYVSTADNNICTFGTLPLIGQEHGPLPTIEQVMDRVVVSHDWMGKNFEDFLRTQDPNGDFRRLLGSVTAVVLGSHVRPSFFYSYTGAIYLDAENLWLTPEQRDVINEAPDFRSDFGSELNYNMVWRYVIGNNFAQAFFSPSQRVSRDTAYLINELGNLMYHELGHANDFYPTSMRAGLTAADNPTDITINRFDSPTPVIISSILDAQLPLNSAEMKALGQVNFQDPTLITDAQKAYTPDQVAGFFKNDVATDEYSYSTIREDLAMLFEEFMMAHRNGLRRDVMVTDKIVSTTTGSNLIVRWGQRGRVADTTIKPRIKLVLQNMAPWIDPAAVDTLAAPITMCAGQSYTQNLTLPCTPNAAPQKTSLADEYKTMNIMAAGLREASRRATAHHIQERFSKKTKH